MRNNLDLLLSEGIIDEVLGRLQGGKEADVFRVLYRGQEVAAKVYKDREHRSFKHNASYKEGRKVRNSRTQRAMDKGSRFGRDEAEDAWKASEAKALHLLHGHGVRVPHPVMFYEGVLLMELVTDADGDAAPRLIDAPIAAEQAGALYRDLRGQIIGMLCCDLIHGDLSPYNVLLGAAGPTIIDLPQTISAAHNTQSEHFFRRDLDNIQRFFAGLDGRLGAHGGDAREIWRAYARRELTPDFVPAMIAREERRPPPPMMQQGARGYQGQRAWSPRDGGAQAPHGPPQRGGGYGHAQAPQPPRGPQVHVPPQVHAQPQVHVQPQPQRAQQPQQPPQRGHGYGQAPAPQGPRAPQRPGRGPVEVYVKRTGMRESAPRVEVAPPPPQVQQGQRPQPQAPQAEGGEGRRRRRR